MAEAADGGEAVRLARVHRPDLAVLDVAMPGMSGIEAAAQIRAEAPATRILALSMYGDEHYQRRMFAAGAAAYLVKNEASAELIQAIETVMGGGTFVSPALAATGAAAGTAAVPSNAELEADLLTVREREVLALLAQGRRTKEIAAALAIGAKTVETYRARIMMKLRVDNVPDLVRFAIRAGIAPLE